jgi:hypothetical protein
LVAENGELRSSDAGIPSTVANAGQFAHSGVAVFSATEVATPKVPPCRELGMTNGLCCGSAADVAAFSVPSGRCH